MMENAKALKELGRRLRKCREQAGLSFDDLAQRSGLKADAIEGFEFGHGGLGMAGVVRIARELGVPRESFLDPSAAEPRAYLDPHVLLLSPAMATLEPADRDRLEDGLFRASAFLEVGGLTQAPPLANDEALFKLVATQEEGSHAAGYERAREARSCLADWFPARAPDDGPLRNLARLIEDAFGILVIDLPFASPQVREASCRRGPARVIAVDPRQPETSRRWALAHGLAHQFLDLEEEEGLSECIDEHFDMNKPPKEQRADAFAAMFLAPRKAVEALMKGRSPDELGDARRAVQECRRRLGLNFVPMTRQLQNLRLVSDGVAEALLASAGTETVEGFEDPRRYDGLSRRVYAALADGWISRGRAVELDPNLTPP